MCSFPASSSSRSPLVNSAPREQSVYDLLDYTAWVERQASQCCRWTAEPPPRDSSFLDSTGHFCRLSSSVSKKSPREISNPRVSLMSRSLPRRRSFVPAPTIPRLRFRLSTLPYLIKSVFLRRRSAWPLCKRRRKPPLLCSRSRRPPSSPSMFVNEVYFCLTRQRRRHWRCMRPLWM